MSLDMFPDPAIEYLIEHEFKQEPHRWAWDLRVEILDPDGWRVDGKDFHEPITRTEFIERLSTSTIRIDSCCPLIEELGW